MSYAEIEVGQAALVAYDGDPLRAIEVGDPTFCALVAAARAPAAGVHVAELFHTKEDRHIPQAERLDNGCVDGLTIKIAQLRADR